MTRYDPNRDLPDFARNLKTLSPSKLSEEVLKKRNEEVTPQSITMFFKRHPALWESLNAELVEGLPTEAQAVDTSIFQNGSFDQISSVKEWTQHLRVVRRVREETIKKHVGILRQICYGRLPQKKIDLVQEGTWCLKHPDRLTYKDGKEFLNLIIQKGCDPCAFAKTLKSFLLNKGITEATQFLVGKGANFGKYKEMFVKESTLEEMLKWILETYGLEAYTMDLLMYKRAYRIHAVVKANIEDLSPEGKITLYEKAKQSKYGLRGKPVTHALKPHLVENLRTIAEGRLSGRFSS